MRVNVGVVGRFHAFDLAKQLNNYGILNKLITTYPSFKVKEWGLKDKQIVTEVILELLNRYRKKIPLINDKVINNFVNKCHAKNCANFLKECDVHIGWSGSSLETILEAKKMGKIVVLERGSSHYSHQMKILKEEYKYFNLDVSFENYFNWQRELLEYELADYISIPSSFVKKSFIDQGFDESKLILNPYGVNLQSFKKIDKEDDVFRIIFTGAGSLRKGYHYLLQAFSELDLPNCELWHIGSLSSEMKSFIKKFKNDNWILKGVKPQKELYKYYSQGSIFVLPSLEEGLAMVQCQAMACGLPLVCSKNTGGEDLISTDGEEGFIIPIRSVDSIKEKILFLYENQNLCKEMGQKAKKQIESGFSWSDYGKRYVNNLKKL